MCLLDLYKPYLRRLEVNLNCPGRRRTGAGSERYLFGYFGTVGGTIIFLMLSFISVLYLTNFRLGNWLNAIWATRSAAQPGSEKEQTLEKRAKDLEKRKKELEEEVAASGIGADMKPVPEPTVRDLSVP